MTELFAVTILLLPFMWSALASGLRRLSVRGETPDDAAEKRQLLIMIAPVVAGLVFIAVSRIAPAHLHLPSPLPVFEADGEGPTVMAATTHAATPPGLDWAAMIAPGLLVIYTTVAVIRVATLIFAFARLSHIVRRSRLSQVAGETVRITAAPVPPLAWSRNTILLPQNLAASFSDDELRIIVRHERAHLDRSDPLYFAALGWIEAMLWFNPFVRVQTARCRMAAEIACDAAVLRGTPVSRETYARVLIGTLKHTAADVRPGKASHAPAVFSNVKSGDYRMRIEQIMYAGNVKRNPRPRLYAALGIAALPFLFAQLAWSQGAGSGTAKPPVAWSHDAVPHDSGTLAVRENAILSLSPVDAPVTSPYGMRRDPLGRGMRFHGGVDFAVPAGTPIHAPGNGTAGAIYSDPGDGKVLEIAYGGGVTTRMTHLSRISVKWGDKVKAGDVVATSGSSGISTGPHLHFEVRVKGRRVDPVRMDSALTGKAS
ncbi:MAG: M23/M56 family metallopeptidase [Asticcacaulis sp.]